MRKLTFALWLFLIPVVFFAQEASVIQQIKKEGLENFISTFSGKINEYYQYMNPGEPFQDIAIETIGEEDE